MALNFPDNPIIGDIYTDNTSGFSYEWDGVVWKSYTPSTTNNISILDDISGFFNGIQDTFALTVGSSPIRPANAQQLRIVLNDIIQEPNSDYTVSGTSLIFTTPPAGGLSFSGLSFGIGFDMGVPGDGTVTPAKLSTGGPVWNSSGDVYISGITTINDKVKVGVGTTALIVEGDARITGILTIGTSSITLDGSSNTINVGAAVTISTSDIKVGELTIGSSGIIGSAATFTNLTVNGTQTIINTTSLEISDKTIGIGSTSTPSDSLADGSGIIVYGDTNKSITYNNTKKAFETNIALATNETRIITGAEKVHRQSGNTVTLTYNSSSSSNIGYTTNPTGNITLNVVGVPTSSDFDDHSITFAVIVNNTGTARTCTAVNINGVAETIRWAGGSLSAALSGVTTTTGHTIFSFTGINTVGSASTAANYQVFGSVNGGFW